LRRGFKPLFFLAKETLPDSFGVFVSSSHWFQAGIRLYHARKWKPAYRLLKKAYENRTQFRDASRMEIDRYFCLSATRMRKYAESEACISRLNADNRSKPFAAFLTADLHEYKREFPEAVRAYGQALELNRDKERRREFIYRPMIRCMLASWNPDFARAEALAKAYVVLKRTLFSLSSLARVYLHWQHRELQVGREPPQNIESLYQDALRALEVAPGAGAEPFELYAEEAEFTGDFTKALEYMDQAIHLAPDRFQLRAEKWRLMAASKHVDVAAQAVRELDAARRDRAFEAIWSSYIHSLAETYARALVASGQPIAIVNSFAPELQQTGELGQIIIRSRRP
jgi:tetratricopeptide (TPR) repeat protein